MASENPIQTGENQSVQPTANGQNPALVYQIETAPKGAQQPKLSFLKSLLQKVKLPSGNDGNTSNENVFTKLFGRSTVAPAPPVPPAPKAVVNPVPSLSMLLGPKPKFSRAAFEEAEKKRTKMAKSVFRTVLLLALLIYGFFYSQLTPDFKFFSEYVGPNIAERFESTNSELKKKQTDLNRVRYRMARLWLDDINGDIDVFQTHAAIAAAETAIPSQKAEAEVELQIVGARIKKSLSEAQKIFNQPLGIDLYSQKPVSSQEREREYATLLRDAFSKEKAALASQPKPNPEELRRIDNVLRLVENKKFRDTLRTQDFTKISEADFSSMLEKIREEGTDELSSIQKLRSKRLDWATIIRDIHTVARKVDLYYGQGLFKTVGGFLFSSYKFDSKTGRINMEGLTKTSDSKTFSSIAKLVDAIEKSVKFKDIDFRSFAKNRDEKGDFSSTLSFDFAIQQGPDSRDDVIELKNPPKAEPSILEPSSAPPSS